MADALRKLLAAVVDRWRPLAVVLGAVVVVNLLLHFLVIRDVVRTSGDREAILATRQGKLHQKEVQVAALERAASKLACTRSDLKHLFEDVLSSKEERLTAILREVRQLAASNGMDPERIAYSVSAMPRAELVKFGISFPLAGPYETLRKFIRQVEDSPNFLVIEDVSLAGDRAQGLELKLGVKLTTFFQAPDLEALKAAFPTLEAKP